MKSIFDDENKEESSDDDTTNRSTMQEKVTCAKCETEISKEDWNSHNLLKHNYMSWTKDDAPIDFESDVKLWKRVLTIAIKKKKGQLHCEKCNNAKRSVTGFISHAKFCGKTEAEQLALMATCSTCGAVMKPTSLEMHEKSHKGQTKKSVVKKAQLNTSGSPKVKRKAAQKAVSKISEFAKLVNDPPKKKMKIDIAFLKRVINEPKVEKTIPSIRKSMWKKQLTAKGHIKCQELNCTYVCNSYEEMCKHYANCNFVPQKGYLCKLCKFTCSSNEEMITHVTELHAEEKEPGSDFEAESYTSSEEERSYKKSYKEQTQRIKYLMPYAPAVEWSIEFETKNYEFHLFDDYIPNKFTLLSNKSVLQYLPELELSMRTEKEKFEEIADKDIPWKQWNRFEGGSDEDTFIFFTGGPVWAVAWLPIPIPMHTKEPCQYLAISTHPKMSSEYSVGKSHPGPNIIQIWSVGPLTSETDSKEESKFPTLSYAIAHNSGTIWCLEWCPSGCYQDESLNNYKKESKSSLRRMGMLAAACSDGNVHIYSLPFPEELKFKKTVDNQWPIYKTDPVITLIVNISMYDSKNQNWQCTKLSWTKERKHNTIAAGFSNGYIAVWDLTYMSPLSLQKRRHTYFINAFQHFWAHSNSVTMVCLVPYNGERFLATASLDRTYKFWDLENTTSPQIGAHKNFIVNGAWMTHMPCAVISFDDTLGYQHTNSYLISLREFEFKYYPVLATNSPTYALGVSDYANGIAHGTLAGEIVTVFVHNLIKGRDYINILKRRKLSSYVKVVDLLEEKKDEETKDENKNDNKNKKDDSKNYDYTPDNYNECHDRFGLIFCDNLKSPQINKNKKSVFTDHLNAVPTEQYPFMSVNRISWNPNAWSYVWMAVGYQNGLVRLINFKYMSVSDELKQEMLQEYTKKMLNKTNKSATDRTNADKQKS